ncbi:hypothetical protein ACQP3F_34725, partial [Escherichia coli]
ILVFKDDIYITQLMSEIKAPPCPRVFVQGMFLDDYFWVCLLTLLTLLCSCSKSLHALTLCSLV